jgi:solute carrier family 35 protein F1/2
MGQYLSIELSPFALALIQGQWISILIAGTGVFATILSETKPSTNFPLLMNMCNYALLSIFLTRKHCKREKPITADVEIKIKSNENVNKIWYIAAAILDVEANYLVLLAYNYTTITSVMLLDCFTIPCAMVLSYFFLGCRYTRKHLTGTLICLSGLICIIINDSVNGDHKRGSDPVRGDILCLCGAVLYASSNVLQEHLVKFHDRDEFLGHLGGFGFVLALIQCIVIDLPGMRTANFTTEVILSIVGFVSCLFLMYVNTSSFLEQSDAILFNLSLLTSDVYAVVFTYFFEGYLVGWPYFLSFALVIVGLVVYHTEQPPSVIGLQQLQNEEGDEVTAVSGSEQSNRLFGFTKDSEPRYNPILGDGLDEADRR